MLEYSNLDSSGKVSELSEVSGTSSSTKLTENSSEEEWVDSIYYSGLMARMRKTIRPEQGPGTSGAGTQGGSEIHGRESQSKAQTKSTKNGKKRRCDPGVMAAELVMEDQKAKQGRKD